MIGTEIKAQSWQLPMYQHQYYVIHLIQMVSQDGKAKMFFMNGKEQLKDVTKIMKLELALAKLITEPLLMKSNQLQRMLICGTMDIYVYKEKF